MHARRKKVSLAQLSALSPCGSLCEKLFSLELNVTSQVCSLQVQISPGGLEELPPQITDFLWWIWTWWCSELQLMTRITSYKWKPEHPSYTSVIKQLVTTIWNPSGAVGISLWLPVWDLGCTSPCSPSSWSIPALVAALCLSKGCPTQLSNLNSAPTPQLIFILLGYRWSCSSVTDVKRNF